MTPFALIRYAVLALAGALCLAGFAAMAVQRRLINPFSRPARLIRRATDPLLRPFERRLARGGGNPQSAPWWLVGVALAGGIVVISAVEWLTGQILLLVVASESGTRTLAFVLVNWGFGLLMAAVLVRVIGSWIGAGAFTRWMRPFVWLTEWFLAPLRRVIPAVGPFDVSPMVAWLLLSLLRGFVLARL